MSDKLDPNAVAREYRKRGGLREAKWSFGEVHIENLRPDPISATDYWREAVMMLPQENRMEVAKALSRLPAP